MSPRIIITQHFVIAWERRISSYLSKEKVSDSIRSALNSGKVRKKDNSGVSLVVLDWPGVTAYVIGSYNKRGEFVLKTVMDKTQAGAMGWNQDKLKATLAAMAKTKKSL